MTDNRTRHDFSRREFAAGLIATTTALSMTGCVPSTGANAVPDSVWGRKGLSDGKLMKPRAMTIDENDELYVVDITGRVQVFNADGEFQRNWNTPAIKQGRPTGLGVAIDGSILVADTHYYQVLVYSKDGELDTERTIGGEYGDGPSQFHFVTDVVQDKRGHFYVGQYGQIDRIQEFAPDGSYLREWGKQGSEPGEFSRPQAIECDKDGLVWIADACNHRIQVYDVSGPKPELVKIWGKPGKEIGELQTPYGIAFDQDATLLVAEFGNHRIQRFSREGEPLEFWGSVGTDPGQLQNPWAVVVDSKRNMHVLDTMNHRLQRYSLS